MNSTPNHSSLIQSAYLYLKNKSMYSITYKCFIIVHTVCVLIELQALAHKIISNKGAYILNRVNLIGDISTI